MLEKYSSHSYCIRIKTDFIKKFSCTRKRVYALRTHHKTAINNLSFLNFTFMKKLPKEEMKKVMGGYESDESPGCNGLTRTTSQECREVLAGNCYSCSDGTKHCG